MPSIRKTCKRRKTLPWQNIWRYVSVFSRYVPGPKSVPERIGRRNVPDLEPHRSRNVSGEGGAIMPG